VQKTETTAHTTGYLFRHLEHTKSTTTICDRWDQN